MVIGSLVVETVVVASVASVCVVTIVDVANVVVAVVISVGSVFVGVMGALPHEARKTVVSTTIKHIIFFNATPPQTE